MESGITDSARSAMVRAAMDRVGGEELTGALALTADPGFTAPAVVANALKALRRHRDPRSVMDRPQYRVALPYLAAAVADDCLARTIEVLGDHSDDPSEDQLLAALDEVSGSFPESTVAVMLASVADADMPASDLCFRILAGEGRFALSGWSAAASAGGDVSHPVEAARAAGPTPEQRRARREKKAKDAEERRKKADAARRAGEQLRRERKKERQAAASGSGSGAGSGAQLPPSAPSAPRVTRRATLTPLQEEEFARTDPLVGEVVFAWVPFDPDVPDPDGTEGKSRRCVVVAGSPTHLLVRPGYSEGGAKSRDWKAVPVRHWKRAGFDRPTWIDAGSLRVPRPSDQVPVGRLDPEDWNALW